MERNFKIGDKVCVSYFYDCCPYNGKIGEIIWLNDYKFYPNGTPDYFVMKTQGIIKYDDGKVMSVTDMNRKDGGVVSPVVKVEVA